MAHMSVSKAQAGTDFDQLFDHWLAGLKEAGGKESTRVIMDAITRLNHYHASFSYALLKYIRGRIHKDSETIRIASSWIRGDQNLSYQDKRKIEIKGKVDRDNAFGFLKGFLKLSEIMGYPGVVFLVDETEWVMEERADIRQKAYLNMRQFMDMMGSQEVIRLGLVFAGTPRLFEDQEKGIQSYDALYQRVGQEVDTSRVNLINSAQLVIDIPKMTSQQYEELTNNIIQCHMKAYDYSFKKSQAHFMGLALIECKKKKQETVRTFIKELITLLDIAYEKPELPLFNI